MIRTGLALLAVVLSAIAVFGAVRLATADESVQVSRNTVVNPPAPIDANNSPSLTRNPRSPQELAATHRVDRPTYSASLDWSIDGGATWQPTPLPLPQGKDRPFAPDVAFGPDGTLFVTYVNLQGPGNVPENLWVSSSTDGGRSLSDPVMVAGRLAFQPRIAVGADGAVHVVWLQGSEVGLLALAGPPSPVVASRSTDGGRTFSVPVRVSDTQRELVGAASPVIDSKGRLVVLYEDFKDDRRDFSNLDGPPWDNPFTLVLTRSTDGGASFSPGVEVERDVIATRRFLVFLPEFPSLAAGPDDNLYASWADGRNGDEDVFLRRSSDGGRTWSAPVRVNDNPTKDGTTQYLPRVATAPDGRVDVVFLDRRRDRDNNMTDATLASSHDRGRSFTNYRISSSSFDARVGPVVATQFGVDFGSRLALSAGKEDSLALWTDTRLGTADTGRQDVVAVAYKVSRPTSAIARVPVIAGLMVLAFLALGGSWFLGRRPLAAVGDVSEESAELPADMPRPSPLIDE